MSGEEIAILQYIVQKPPFKDNRGKSVGVGSLMALWNFHKL